LGKHQPGLNGLTETYFVREQRDLLARVAEAGRTNAWTDVGLPDDYAAIAREGCAAQLR